jgi:heme exporter protein D
MDAMGMSGLVWLALGILGLILAIAWIILPFALIGTKPLLRRILDEQIRMNALLASLAAARRPQTPKPPSRREP